MTITLPDLSLVLLVGPSGAGKSTFARRHFKPTEVLSSDFFRGMVADDEGDQRASGAAFELLHLVAAKRLAGGRLTVIDATNVKADARRPLIDLARRYHVPLAALVFDLPPEVCADRNRLRAERSVGPDVVRRHADALRSALGRLPEEGFRRLWTFTTPEDVDAAEVVRQPAPTDKRHARGPFDVIGDVHGCKAELLALLGTLGYALSVEPDADGRPAWRASHPAGRTLVFVGDLNDRGPDTPGVLRLVMGLVEAGRGYCVRGNHDEKLLKYLKGKPVKVNHGLEETLAQFAAEPPGFADRVRAFLDATPSHLVFDGGKLVVAHAGLSEELQGRSSGRVWSFALYGKTTGEVDEYGLPVRLDWAADYRGRAAVVYGHTPTAAPEWVNRTLCIDTGCAFGGALTALRYPEMEAVGVPAAREYVPSKRPFAFVGLPAGPHRPEAVGGTESTPVV